MPVSRSKGPIPCTPPCAKMIVVLERKPNSIFALVGIRVYFRVRPRPARNFCPVKFLLSSAMTVTHARNFRCCNARHWDRAFGSIDSWLATVRRHIQLGRLRINPCLSDALLLEISAQPLPLTVNHSLMHPLCLASVIENLPFASPTLYCAWAYLIRAIKVQPSLHFDWQWSIGSRRPHLLEITGYWTPDLAISSWLVAFVIVLDWPRRIYIMPTRLSRSFGMRNGSPQASRP